MQDLAKMASTIAQATVALERIQAILETEIVVAEKPEAIDPGRLNGNIVFEDVSFAYNAESPVLKCVNIRINTGERIGICGPSRWREWCRPL